MTHAPAKMAFICIKWGLLIAIFVRRTPYGAGVLGQPHQPSVKKGLNNLVLTGIKPSLP